ncbi:CheR family methyltransferase [Sphaerisporangium dianthi]|uniref:protein-glutamate O-methyltransferase n=1 Tax=Sphaerisporangium dianthi TaxID=1436120 RepID=A0ABV9CDH3_9ACTN
MHPGAERDFHDLLLMLKETRGFDFTGYKRTTLMRRISRRLETLQLNGYGEYRDHLELEPDEFARLFDSLLINVTAFFRDPAAWQVLRETAIPALLSAKGAGDPIRVWSAGCATGEEAYSLAMLLAEELGMEQFRNRVKIYATDLDDTALKAARTATYNDRQLKDLPAELLERYFEPAGAGFAFRRDLRRQLIFGRNDLTRDAPISRVDLLLARNTLMYFNAETQLSVVRRFHFALNHPGYLFLGKAEMLLNHGERFEPVDLRTRLFCKIAPTPPGGRPSRGAAPAPAEPVRRLSEIQIAALSSGPVAQIALDLSGKLAMANSRAEALFKIAPRDIGRPFQDLEVSYRPVELRSLIEQVELDMQTAEVQGISWRRGGTAETDVFDISVAALQEPGGERVGVVITFHDVTPYRRLRDDLEQANKQLEHAYEELQSLNEELETTNEELQSTNEELETTNEELQSTNEELETMNEELQCGNDELQKINDTLTSRSEELNRANRFIASVVRSLGDAVAVFDGEMRVLMWSPGAEELWGLRAEEATGRHLLTLDIGLPVEAITPALRRLSEDHRSPDAAENTGRLLVDAVNRRGRAIKLDIGVSVLHEGETSLQGLILVMNVL